MKFNLLARYATIVSLCIGASGCAVVTAKNSRSFSTPELCVYAYNHQNLSGWMYDQTEWLAVTRELGARGYGSAQDCSAFSYAVKECERYVSDKNSDTFKTCLDVTAREFKSSTAAVFDRYGNNHARGADYGNIAQPMIDSLNNLLKSNQNNAAQSSRWSETRNGRTVWCSRFGNNVTCN